MKISTGYQEMSQLKLIYLPLPWKSLLTLLDRCHVMGTRARNPRTGYRHQLEGACLRWQNTWNQMSSTSPAGRGHPSIFTQWHSLHLYMGDRLSLSSLPQVFQTLPRWFEPVSLSILRLCLPQPWFCLQMLPGRILLPSLNSLSKQCYPCHKQAHSLFPD